MNRAANAVESLLKVKNHRNQVMENVACQLLAVKIKGAAMAESMIEKLCSVLNSISPEFKLKDCFVDYLVSRECVFQICSDAIDKEIPYHVEPHENVFKVTINRGPDNKKFTEILADYDLI